MGTKAMSTRPDLIEDIYAHPDGAEIVRELSGLLRQAITEEIDNAIVAELMATIKPEGNKNA